MRRSAAFVFEKEQIQVAGARRVRKGTFASESAFRREKPVEQAFRREAGGDFQRSGSVEKIRLVGGADGLGLNEIRDGEYADSCSFQLAQGSAERGFPIAEIGSEGDDGDGLFHKK